jgi:transposase InsO family protein
MTFLRNHRDATAAMDFFVMKPSRTAPPSPWQNGVAERWIGSARRELLDRIVVINDRRATPPDR